MISATAGLTAIKLGGLTIHSPAGLQKGNKTAAQLVAKMVPDAANKWDCAKVILVEEFSMTSAAFWCRV